MARVRGSTDRVGVREIGEKKQTGRENAGENEEFPNGHLLSLEMHKNRRNQTRLEGRHDHPDDNVVRSRTEIDVGQGHRNPGENQKSDANLQISSDMRRDVLGFVAMVHSTSRVLMRTVRRLMIAHD